MNANLYSLFQSRFPGDLNQAFLELEDGRTIPYGDVDPATGRVARLLSDLGVVKGDRVIAQVDKTPEALMFYLGCLRAGAIFIPLNTAYTTGEVEYFMGDAEPKVLLCRPDRQEALKAVADKLGVPHVLTLDDQGQGSLTEATANSEPMDSVTDVAPDDLAAILYTSGTTGRSKGAMLSHANLASNADALHKLWGWVEGDVLLHALPIYHVHGLFVATHTAMLNGSTMIFLEKFDLDKVLERLPRATVMMGVPTFYTRLLGSPKFTKELTANMRLFVAGSAPLLAETFEEFEQQTGHRILERYGMTEAGMITSNPYDNDDRGGRIPATVGFPLPGVEARIADEDGKALPAGEIGVLEIKGPNLFSGYWQMPEKTAEEFRDDGFFITGDMSVMDETGRVSIVGRAKDLIISGGFNVYPKEIEGYIDDLPGVGESAVIGLAHPDFGEAVTAVVTRDGTTDITEESIKADLKDSLAAFKRPKRVFFVDELPRNAMGKVQKKNLREQYADTFTN